MNHIEHNIEEDEFRSLSVSNLIVTKPSLTRYRLLKTCETKVNHTLPILSSALLTSSYIATCSGEKDIHIYNIRGLPCSDLLPVRTGHPIITLTRCSILTKQLLFAGDTEGCVLVYEISAEPIALKLQTTLKRPPGISESCSAVSFYSRTLQTETHHDPQSLGLETIREVDAESMRSSEIGSSIYESTNLNRRFTTSASEDVESTPIAAKVDNGLFAKDSWELTEQLRLVTGYKGAIAIINVATGRVEAMNTNIHGYVWTIRTMQNGEFLTSSADHRVILWTVVSHFSTVKNLKMKNVFNLEALVNPVEVVPLVTNMFIVADNNTLKLFEKDSEPIIASCVLPQKVKELDVIQEHPADGTKNFIVLAYGEKGISVVYYRFNQKSFRVVENIKDRSLKNFFYNGRKMLVFKTLRRGIEMITCFNPIHEEDLEMETEDGGCVEMVDKKTDNVLTLWLWNFDAFRICDCKIM
eukprot:TRINITY_DN13490_c0_g1_i1.p1 TRINITY_DN13490_c0_g1~~TRINITY_DN13490_c0_g1_i1.p1  ORF type:complete len:469 (-),score=55.40 TRINITY_DN13490_c0_g1_i1:123-1529(-)